MIKVFAARYGDEWQYKATTEDRVDRLCQLDWQFVAGFDSVEAFQSAFRVPWVSFPCSGVTFFSKMSPEQHQEAWATPYTFGDVLVVRRAQGRIERPYFVVLNANKVRGGGFRYDGVFPGDPLLHGKVYSEDVVCWQCRMSEAECAALALKTSCQERNEQAS
jgi:hypothetical protein